MKPFYTSIILYLCFFAACKKDMNTSNISQSFSTNNITAKADLSCTSRWYALLRSLYTSKTDTIGQHELIHDGYAQVPYDKIDSNDFQTQILLNIPACEIIDGDNVRLDTRIENADTLKRISSASAANTYNVNVWLAGSENEAFVYFNATTENDTYIGVQLHRKKSANLVHLFEGFDKVTLLTKDSTFQVFINGDLKAQKSYAGIHIGVLKYIVFSFVGAGKIKDVKLTDYLTGKIYLKEDFVDKIATFQKN